MTIEQNFDDGSIRQRQILDAQPGGAGGYDGFPPPATATPSGPAGGDHVGSSYPNLVIADGKVIDEKIGLRTLNDGEVPASNTGLLSQILNWFANRLTAITGGEGWEDTPPVTLVDAADHIDAAAPHSGHELTANRGEADGYAPLDSDALVPSTYLPPLPTVSGTASNYIYLSDENTMATGRIINGVSSLGMIEIPWLDGDEDATLHVGSSSPSNDRVGILVDSNGGHGIHIRQAGFSAGLRVQGATTPYTPCIETDGSVVVATLRMTEGASHNRVMVSDDIGLASWTSTLELTNAGDGVATFNALDASSTAQRIPLFVGTQTTATAAPGLATGIGLQLMDSTGSDSLAAQWSASWLNATGGNTQARVVHYVCDTIAREAMRYEADGTQVKVGFFGVNAVARQTGGAATAAATYGATEQAMINRMYTALRNYGLLN